MAQQDATSKVILGIDVREFRKGIAQVDNSIKSISKKFNNLGGIIGATFVVSGLQRFSAEAVELNSQLTKAAAGFKRFGTEADLDTMRESTRGLVTDLELMQQAVKGANLGIPLKDMGTLLAFAKRRADETGESMDYLVNSIVEGVGRKSTRRLDNLGISAQRLKEEVGGVSLEMADIADVSAAMTRIAVEELDKMGDASLTAADEIQQLSVEWKNFTAIAGGPIAKILAKGIKAVTTPLEDLAQAYKEFRFLVFGDPLFEAPKLPEDQEIGTDTESSIVSIKFLTDELANLKKRFEESEIGSAEFNNTLEEMIALEERLNEILTPTVDTIQLQSKGIHDLGLAYQETNGVVLQFGNIMIDEQKRTEDTIRAYERLAKELQNISFIGSQIGYIFKESFGAALENTEDFFTVLKEGFKNYIKQVLAMAAATLALAVTIKLAGGGASFKEIFTEVGLGMGLPFGFDPKDGKLKLAGPDLIGAVQRNQISIDRTGG